MAVDYTAGASPIQDVVGNDAADLDASEVTNTTHLADDATLSALSLGETTLSPAFSPAVSSYDAVVANDVTSATVAATPTDPRAEASYSENYDLTVGPNTVTVTVTAEDGTASDYTVTVTRLQETELPTLTSASLDGTELTLVYSEALDEASQPAGAEFTVSVTDSVTNARSSRTATSVTVSGRTVTLALEAPVRHDDAVFAGYTAGASPIQDLAGNDAVDLDGHAVSNVTPAASEATLAKLSLDGVTLSPRFAAEVRGYSDEVANEVSSTSMTVTAADPRASSLITPSDSSASAGHQVGFAVGLNEITVTVTAEDAITRIVYLVQVTRDVEREAPVLADASADETTLVLSYSETLDEGSVPAGGDFAVSVVDAISSAVSARTVDLVSVAGRTVTLSLNAPVRHGDAVALDYTARTGPIRDLVGNPAASLDDQTVTNLTTAAADATLGALSLDGAVLFPGFSPSLVRYLADVPHDVASSTVTAVPADARAKASVAPADSSSAGGHQVGLEVGQHNEITVTVTAENGTTRTAYTVLVTRDVEREPPVLTEVSARGATLELRYSENLSEASVPAGADFSVSVIDAATDAMSSRAAVSVSLSGREVTLTLDVPVRHGDTVTIGYTARARPIQDLAGNDAANLALHAASNTTPAADDATLADLSLGGATLSPAFLPRISSYTATVANDIASITVAARATDPRAEASYTASHGLAVGPNEITVAVIAEDGMTRIEYSVTVTRLQETDVPTLASASLDGVALVLRYSETLDDGSVPAGRDFSVTVTDAVTDAVSSRAINSVSVTGRSVILTLGEPARYRDAVTVRYTSRDSPIRDHAGNDAAGFVGQVVSNASRAADDATLDTLALDGVMLSPRFSPGVRSYTATVAADVTSTTVTAVAADPRATALFTAGHDLAVGANAIVVTVTAENGSTRVYTVSVTRMHESEMPMLTSASVNGASLVLRYSEALDSRLVPAGGDFSVSVIDAVTGAASTTVVSAAVIRGRDVSLALDAPVLHRDTVTVDYTTGASPIRDVAGNDAADLVRREVTNTTTQSADTSLAALSLSVAALSPPFSTTLFRYAVDVGSDVAEITVSPLAVDSRGWILITPADSSRARGHQVRLTPGNNTITVAVTDEDDTTCVAYILEVTRSTASTSREQLPMERDDSSTRREGRATDQVTATEDTAGSSPQVIGLRPESVGAAKATLELSLSQPATTIQAVLVRYRAAATLGSGGWTTVATSVAGDSGQVTLFGLDPSAVYTAEASTHPAFPAASTVSASFTTTAAPTLAIDDDQYTLSPSMYLTYGNHQNFKFILNDNRPYDSDRSPSDLHRYFGMPSITRENVDDDDLSFAVDGLPDKSTYQFCWYAGIVRDIDATRCGDLEVKMLEGNGWLFLYADHGTTSTSRKWRASPYLYDYPTQRMELSSADSNSGLRVFKDVFVRPPANTKDCSDYPLPNRDRYNCLFNAEQLPPAPDVGADEDLLHESLRLEQSNDNYGLVFREEFDTDDTKTGCENLATLDSSVWAHSPDSCHILDTNGNTCESMNNGAYRISISFGCRPRGLGTRGNFELKYGYIEIQFTLRIVSYSIFINHNIVLGTSRHGRNMSLKKYNVPVDNIEQLTTNVDIEIDFIECRNAKRFCISHQYTNRPPIPYFSDVPQLRTVKYIRLCQTSSSHHSFSTPDCPTSSTEPFDLEMTITKGVEWTPRGYQTFAKAEGTGDGDDFIPIKKSGIRTQCYTDDDLSSFFGALRNSFFEELDPVHANFVREQLGTSHVPSPISVGVWQQGISEANSTNEIWMEINYIRIFQPEDKYASMEPVYK